jgi:hypothetical protein
VESATNLQRAADQAGVGHVVTLSIVGIDRVAMGYYAAKVQHECAALDGPVLSTILRATQFHEFPSQVICWTRDGDRAQMCDVRVQTVAARTVGETLLQTATAPPAGRAPDLGGPQEADLVDLARLAGPSFEE